MPASPPTATLSLARRRRRLRHDVQRVVGEVVEGQHRHAAAEGEPRTDPAVGAHEEEVRVVEVALPFLEHATRRREQEPSRVRVGGPDLAASERRCRDLTQLDDVRAREGERARLARRIALCPSATSVTRPTMDDPSRSRITWTCVGSATGWRLVWTPAPAAGRVTIPVAATSAPSSASRMVAIRTIDRARLRGACGAYGSPVAGLRKARLASPGSVARSYRRVRRGSHECRYVARTRK